MRCHGEVDGQHRKEADHLAVDGDTGEDLLIRRFLHGEAGHGVDPYMQILGHGVVHRYGIGQGRIRRKQFCLYVGGQQRHQRGQLVLRQHGGQRVAQLGVLDGPGRHRMVDADAAAEVLAVGALIGHRDGLSCHGIVELIRVVRLRMYREAHGEAGRGLNLNGHAGRRRSGLEGAAVDGIHLTGRQDGRPRVQGGIIMNDGDVTAGADNPDLPFHGERHILLQHVGHVAGSEGLRVEQGSRPREVERYVRVPGQPRQDGHDREALDKRQRDQEQPSRSQQDG